MDIKYEIEGIEKLPSSPCIVLSNHQSFWENFFMQIIIPEHSWVIKRELFDIPVFGWGLRMVEPIAVDRSTSSSIVQILQEGAKKLKAGLSIVIFPEGTRVKPYKSVNFKPSAAKLAIETKVPIVLMAHNAGLLWPKGFWFQKSGIINVKIIECLMPNQFTHYDVRDLTNYIQERINTEKNSLAKEAISFDHDSIKTTI